MTQTKDLKKRKEQLVEKLGVHLESKDQLAPLAARIFGSLILTGKRGQTFEELVHQLNASKSTIFTHLNSLQGSGRVSYFTKPGDRKRYFIVAPNRLPNLMEEMLANWNAQKKIHTEILNYKIEVNNTYPEEPQLELDFHKDYLAFLQEAGNAIQKLKQNLLNKQHKNE